MKFGWLKQIMPRGLYGRAALILIVPVMTIQLVISVVFIQRHFERVTQQMTGSMAREVALMGDLAKAAPDLEIALPAMRAVAGPLELLVELPAPEGNLPDGNFRRPWLDLTGIVVISTLQEELPDLVGVDLADSRYVRVFLPSHNGLVQIDFARRSASASNPHQLLVLMIVVSLLMTIIAYLFLRNQLRPIRRMAFAAEEFGKGRTVPYRISGATEVRKAGAAFLDMRARIMRHLEQRTLMLSGVSHDLRTPLTRLKLGLSMLPRDGDTEDEIEAMERDVSEMGRLVDAFLDFARDGAISGEPEVRDPCVFVRQVVEGAARTGFPVRLVDCPGEGSVEMSFRPDALRRAMENLIGNAARYGTRTEVLVALRPAAFEIRIEDDGPGIPPDAREEALKPFTRLDPARNQDKGPSVGLGLSIAADVLRAHGGMLKLETSERLGGLCARMILPR